MKAPPPASTSARRAEWNGGKTRRLASQGRATADGIPAVRHVRLSETYSRNGKIKICGAHRAPVLRSDDGRPDGIRRLFERKNDAQTGASL